ncbi:MAG TPA: CDP-alcohol phosphatidyltransferase family protein [Polyangiaceae bacterium]
MPNPWTLLLTVGGGDPMRPVGGVPLVRRLVLEAQRTFAETFVVCGSSPEMDRVLDDPRITLKRLPDVPTHGVTLELPAHCLVHRQTFLALQQLQPSPGALPERLTLDALPPPSDTPYWFAPIAVVDANAAKQAERALFRSLRKREDGWTARWLNRYISLAISRYLARTRLHPNQLSFAILLVGLFGAYLASLGTYATMALGALLFQLQSILDGCDGELSRVTFRGSYLGEWLDTIGDDITNYSFFVGAAIGLYRNTGSTLYLVAGAVTLCSGLLASGLEYRYLLSIHSGDLLKYPLSQATTSQSGRFGSIAPLFKRDTFVFLTLIAALFDVLGAALVAFSVGALGVLASVLSTEMRLARERKASRTT